jgi:predicted phage terminase large subunit-like protein
MRTTDNAENLDDGTIRYLVAEYGGTTLGRQELEGEFIEALEGSILRRHDWQWYPVEGSFYGRGDVLARPYEQIVHSWDTALKDKTSSDFVAGQVWGVTGPDRYLLRTWHGHASLNATVAAMRELREWALAHWPRAPHRLLVENTANGPDAIAQMRREVDGVYPVTVKGDKVQRVLAASPALETGHCWLPGFADPNPGGKGYGVGTPADVQAFVEEAAMFRGDMKHAHDDQVDAWSQMVNWTRSRSGQPRSRMAGARAMMPEPGSMVRR